MPAARLPLAMQRLGWLRKGSGMNDEIEDLAPGAANDVEVRGPEAEDLMEAVFGVTLRSARTMWGSLVQTPRVARAALLGDQSIYFSPLRVFLFLFGLHLAIASLIGAPSSPLLENWLPQSSLPDAHQWAEAAGADWAAMNDSIARWYGFALWPIFILCSLPYILLLKAYRPHTTLWGHTLVYIITNIAMFVAMFLVTPLMLVSAEAYAVGSLATFLVFFVAAGRLIAALYAKTALGAGLKIAGLILLTPPLIVLMGGLQIALVYFALDIEHGVNFLEIFTLTSGASS